MEQCTISKRGAIHKVLPDILLTIQEKILDGWRFSPDMKTNKEFRLKMVDGKFAIVMIRNLEKEKVEEEKVVTEPATDADSMEGLTKAAELRAWAKKREIDVPSNKKNPFAIKKYLREFLANKEQETAESEPPVEDKKEIPEDIDDPFKED